MDDAYISMQIECFHYIDFNIRPNSINAEIDTPCFWCPLLRHSRLMSWLLLHNPSGQPYEEQSHHPVTERISLTITLCLHSRLLFLSQCPGNKLASYTLFLMSTADPYFTNILNTSTWPLMAAFWRAVSPYCNIMHQSYCCTNQWL